MAGKRKKPTAKAASTEKAVEFYDHPEAKGSRVPDASAQSFLKGQHPPGNYRYDSSLSPSLEWDEQNPARDAAETLIRAILEAGSLDDAKAAAEKLKAMSGPFLNWAGKAERPNLDVPTLPLFVHEWLSTKGIIETLKGHRRNRQLTLFDLFHDPQHSLGEQATRAYEHGPWSNRMILGDNLAVMHWLLSGENMGGQVQMIYMDPPYGIKYGSNFQPFVRIREVSNNDDDDLTREPEMVQAYRDTWQLGLHSYLTYMRDRLTVARDLLHPTGSIFVQISDENLHHVKHLLDEVFKPENFIVTIVLKKKGATTPTDPVNDFILWYARDWERAKNKITRLYERRRQPEGDAKFNTLISLTGEMARQKDLSERDIELKLAEGWKWARVNYPIVSQHEHAERSKDYLFKGKLFKCGKNRQWSFDNPAGMDRLAATGRLFDGGGSPSGE